jgi:hypothetical protein
MTKALDASDIKRLGGNDAVREFLDSAQAPADLDEVASPPDIMVDGRITADTGKLTKSNGHAKAPTHEPYVEQRGRDVLMVETMMVKPVLKPEAPTTGRRPRASHS